MAYVLAADEFTVRLYSSRLKTSPKRRQTKSSTPSTINSSPASTVKSSRSSTVKTSTRSSLMTSTRSTVKQESDSEADSRSSSVHSSSTNIGIFPAPEPIRSVFCCTTVEPNGQSQAHTLGSTALILQRGRLRNFLEYVAEYSLSNGLRVVEDHTWSQGAEYLVRVLRYGQEDAFESRITTSPRKKRKAVLTSRRKGKAMVKKTTHVKEWKQSAPGRYFVEVKHVKGQRRSDHAFDEVLVTEGMDGILDCFEMVEEITMEAECSVHSGVKWVCEFWAKKE
ncbi:hypothetical protein N431DRAFT_474415 [Stipitochalara longipes BDJ]|nr:hypothetical protein N431DRAFT_474415 [Stipitochalara longipes BDJ]